MTEQDIKTLARLVAAELYELQNKTGILINQNEAFRRYGRTQVENLVRNGRIDPRTEGNRKLYNRKQLDRLLL